MIVRRMRNARVVKAMFSERDGYAAEGIIFLKKTAGSTKKKETLRMQEGEERERNVSGVSW